MKLFYKKLYAKNYNYRRFFLKFMESFLEERLLNTVNLSIRIRMYNVIDYYELYASNTISHDIKYFIGLFPRDQKKMNRDVKTSLYYLCLGILRCNSYLIATIVAKELARNRRTKKLLNFLFRIIREVFYHTPLEDEYGYKQRADYLKIQISGKISGKMRAVKKIYSFSKYKGKQIPLQTYKLNVDYSLVHCYTYAGVLGVKVWVC